MKTTLGATVVDENRTRFAAFSTRARTCCVRLFGDDGRILSTRAMKPEGGGYFSLVLDDVGAGALYKFVLDERELPDPYARFLPMGVHGPAMVVSSSYAWRSGKSVSRPLAEQVLYEIHVGTFTAEGTYRAAGTHLLDLARLGVTTIELMPIAAFPGERGWGYDGVAFYAPYAPYGTPDELRRFIDDAHALGLEVLLDVVYNHFGPMGNYLGAYSPEYFDEAIHTVWGPGPNLELPEMRRYIVDNARYWLTEFRFDGLRLDAVHAIVDLSPQHVIREIASLASTLEPRKVLIAEDDRNDETLVRELGVHAIWADDFHHQLHVTLTAERDGYYSAYQPGVDALAESITRGWLYEGQEFPPSGKPRGKSAPDLAASCFVYCLQNHDQVGNRAFGERLSDDITTDAYCAASMLLLFLPMTPLLFMGQEWGATSPFLFFTDHEEPLGGQVSAGRRQEFKAFEAFASEATREKIPDPQARSTFERSRLSWEERERKPHDRVLKLYRELLFLRRSDPVLRECRRDRLRAEAHGDLLVVSRWNDVGKRVLVVNFGKDESHLAALALTDVSPMLLTKDLVALSILPAESAVIFAAPL